MRRSPSASRKGPLPLALVLDLGAQIAEGLAAAHKAGIVHRDLKPANIMLVRGPSASGPPAVKLLDFGLAKLTGHGEAPAATPETMTAVRASLTGRGTIVGTLPYMAPEQVQGLEADARTDIWALGTILYEMITGTRAFEASTAGEPHRRDSGARACAAGFSTTVDAALASTGLSGAVSPSIRTTAGTRRATWPPNCAGSWRSWLRRVRPGHGRPRGIGRRCTWCSRRR